MWDKFLTWCRDNDIIEPELALTDSEQLAIITGLAFINAVLLTAIVRGGH